MKLKKRFIPLLLLLLLAFAIFPLAGMTAVVEADTLTGTLTIQDVKGITKTTSSYSAYQIVSFGTDSTNISEMSVNGVFKNAIIGAVPGLTTGSSNTDIITAISKLNADQTAALAIALKGVSANPDYTTTVGVFNGINYGYYLVIETANNANDGTIISKPILVTVSDTNVAVKVKTSNATIEKKIVENGKMYDSTTVASGAAITYQTTSDIPSYPGKTTAGITYTYVVTDTFSKGLDFNEGSLIAKVVKDGVEQNLYEDVDYELTTSVNASNETTFQLKLLNSDDLIKWGNAGYKLIIKYEAELNEEASYGKIGNPNTVFLSYSIKGNVIYETPSDTVITYTTKLVIKKTGTGNLPLSGAIFKLSIENSSGGWTNIGELTTDVNGIASFNQLKPGRYQLEETQAPDGYKRLKDPIEFTVTAKNDDKLIPDSLFTFVALGNADAADKVRADWICNNSKFTVIDGVLNIDIENTAGFILPGTGGIGTTIFTILGIVVIILGACMGIVYYKRSKHISNVK